MNKYKVKDLFDIEKGSLQSSKNISGEFNFITASTDWKTHESYTHECEALIFAMGASGSLGRTHYVNDKFIASDLCFILTPKQNYKNQISMKLYYYYFNFNREDIVKKTETGTSKKSINLKNFSNLEIELIENQEEALKKIEELLPNVNELHKLNNRNSLLIENLHHILLESGIRGDLTKELRDLESPKEYIEELRKKSKLKPIEKKDIKIEIPENWEWVRLGDISTFLGGYAFKSNSYVEHSNNQVIRLGNVKDYQIILEEKQVFVSDEIAQAVQSYKIKVNDILLTMTGTKGKKDYFQTCLVTEEDLSNRDLYLNQRVGCLRNIEGITARYLNYVLKSNTILESVFEQETGTANQANIGADVVRNIMIPFPPIEEQHQIVEKLDSIFKLRFELINEVKKAESLSGKIMKNLFKNVL